MTGSLDRLIEQGLSSIIDGLSIGIQVVPNLLAGGELEAELPRITITCLSQESPDFIENADGVYGVHPVQTTITSIAEATGMTSSLEMEEMNSAVDDAVIFNGNLAIALTAGALKVYGVIPGGCRQEMSGNRIMRHRELLIWARLQAASEGITTEEGEQIETEEGEPIVTE